MILIPQYVLSHQNQILVERFYRKSDNLWIPKIYQAGDTVEFPSIGFACAIAALYEKVAQLL